MDGVVDGPAGDDGVVPGGGQDGATGGVGSIALQLAVARGARVVGTGRPGSEEFLSGLGATPLPYGPGLPERVRALGISRVDRALDVAGAGSLDELISLTNGPQSVVTLADFTGPSREVRLSLGQFGGQPDGRHGLAVAADLAEKGLFHVPVQAVFPASQAAEATRGGGDRPSPREDRDRSHGTHAWPLTLVRRDQHP